MTNRSPDNLARLAQAFGPGAATSILSGESVVIDGVEFVSGYQPESTSDRFFIVKPLDFIEEYRELLEQFRNGNIFEIGIAEGGSTALLALVADPRKLVAVEIETEPLDALTEFIEKRSLQGSVRPYYGVDQADHDRLVELVDEEFGDEPLDLVIDDASHQLALTRASFDSLFPRLRPGGKYIIEDWNNDHEFYAAVARELRDGPEDQRAQLVRAMQEAQTATDQPPPPPQPLSWLVIHLLLARASSGDVVKEILVGDHWVVATRGPVPLDHTFSLTDCYSDYFSQDIGR